GAGLPPLHTLWQNMVLNNSYAPEMSLALELFALVLLGARWRKIKLPHSFQRTLLVSGAIIAATILLVAKQPREAYFIPAFAFAGLGLALILFLALENLRHRRTVTVVAGLLLVLNAVYAQQIHTVHENDNWRADAQIMARAMDSGCLVVPYYFVDWPQWDLYFADPDHRFAPALARLYPDFVTYDVGAKTFASFAGALSPDQAARRFAKEKCVRLWGQIWQRDFGLAPSALTLIQRSQYHAVYALNT